MPFRCYHPKNSRPQSTAAIADVEKKAGENKANFEVVIAAATILNFTVNPADQRCALLSQA
jgi:hypothetical protein